MAVVADKFHLKSGPIAMHQHSSAYVAARQSLFGQVNEPDKFHRTAHGLCKLILSELVDLAEEGDSLAKFALKHET